MKYSVGCELGYQANAASSLILNIEAARTDRQSVVRETLDIEPSCPVEAYLMPESDNRYLKLRVGPGALSVRYAAEVELRVDHRDPASIAEVAPGDLPLHRVAAPLPKPLLSRRQADGLGHDGIWRHAPRPRTSHRHLQLDL